MAYRLGNLGPEEEELCQSHRLVWQTWDRAQPLIHLCTKLQVPVKMVLNWLR